MDFTEPANRPTQAVLGVSRGAVGASTYYNSALRAAAPLAPPNGLPPIIDATALHPQHSHPHRGLRCARRRRMAASGSRSAEPHRHRRRSSEEPLLGRRFGITISAPCASHCGSAAVRGSGAPNRPRSGSSPTPASLSGRPPSRFAAVGPVQPGPPWLIVSLRRPRRIVGAVAPGRLLRRLGRWRRHRLCVAEPRPGSAKPDHRGRQPPPSARRRPMNGIRQGGPCCETGPTASGSQGRPLDDGGF